MTKTYKKIKNNDKNNVVKKIVVDKNEVDEVDEVNELNELNKVKVGIPKIKNSLRDKLKHYKNFISWCIGSYYSIIHGIIIILGIINILFSNNIFYLIVILSIVSIDSLAIVALHDCPLTMLEKKYLGISQKEQNIEFFKNLNINYKCDHYYDNQLEFVINIWCMITIKILTIILMRSVKINMS